VESRAPDPELGLIDAAREFVLRPVVVEVRVGEVLFVELLEGEDIEVIAFLDLDVAPVGCLKHMVQSLDISFYFGAGLGNGASSGVHN